MFLVLAIRSEKGSIFNIGLFSNPVNLIAVLLTFVLQLAVIYLPFVQNIFRTVPLTAVELATCLVVSSTPLWVVEIQKWLARQRLVT